MYPGMSTDRRQENSEALRESALRQLAAAESLLRQLSPKLVAELTTSMSALRELLATDDAAPEHVRAAVEGLASTTAGLTARSGFHGSQRGTTLRRAVASDYAAYVRLFADLDSLRPPVPYQDWVHDSRHRTLVVETAGQIVAYCAWEAYRTHGRICELVVEKPWRGQRLGERLLRAVGSRFREAGLSTWTINVKENNGPARRLYERMGFRSRSRWYEFELVWKSLAVSPDAGASTVRLKTTEDARFERVLKLAPGRLSRWRRDVHEVIVMGTRDRRGLPAGAAAFLPELARVNACYVNHSSALPDLLAALEPFRWAKHDKVTVFVDRDRKVASALWRLGARSVLTVLEMRGPVPLD